MQDRSPAGANDLSVAMPKQKETVKRALPSPSASAKKHLAEKMSGRGKRCCKPPLVDWLAEHGELRKAGKVNLPNHRIADEATEAGYPLSESTVAKHRKYHLVNE